MLKKLLELFSLEPKALLLILAGTVSWSATMVKSGWHYSYGLGFWGPNGHDGVWHIALAESLARGLPAQAGSWDMPVFAGAALQNYHIGFDLALAVLHKVTGIRIDTLYFQIIPPILALLVGLLTYKFVYLWKRSTNYSLLATFFVYFGGSLGWLLGKGESAFWSQQAISTLINPPFALSLIFILSGLIFLLKYFQSHTTCYLLLATFFFGALVQIKVYSGILVLVALGACALYGLFIIHNSKFLILLILTTAISLVVYLPFNALSVGILELRPFWFLETMMGTPDRLGWDKFYSAMTTYRMGEIWLKAIPAYLVAFGIFLVGNVGTRLISIKYYVLSIKERFSNFGPVDVFIRAFAKTVDYQSTDEANARVKMPEGFEKPRAVSPRQFINTVILTGIALPMLFVQRGTSWNTIQFFYYSLFFSGILAGISLGEILSRIKPHATGYLLLATIVILTIPTSIITLKDVYLPSRPPSMLSNSELEALKFLSAQPTGTVLTYPFDRLKAKEAEKNPPRPLYLYESTAYVSAFAKKPTFLEDEVNLDIMGYDWNTRRKQVEDWYKEKGQGRARGFLKAKNIRYVYWLKSQGSIVDDVQLGAKRIFENREVDIYAVE